MAMTSSEPDLTTRPASVAERLGRALFRTHIDNGAAVSMGMAVVGLGFALLFGREIAMLAATGALCTSIVDLPGPLRVKARMYGLAILGATTLTVATMMADGNTMATVLVVAAMSFVSGLITAYGRRALGLGVSAVLSLLFGMAASQYGTMPLAIHAAIFAAGGAAYAVLSLVTAAILDGRNRRMFLSEAVRAFADYLAAKAALYDPACHTHQALANLVEKHAAFIDKLQAARDFIFLGHKTPSRRRWMVGLLALLDCFDMVLSSDADVETLRQSGNDDLLIRLKLLTAGFAADAEALALALSTPGLTFTFRDHGEEIAAFNVVVEYLAATSWGREPMAVSAFRSTAKKLALGLQRLERLGNAAESQAKAATMLPDVDLEAFVHRDRMDPRMLAAHLNWSSPVLRYAVRLTMAMTCGYLLTLVLPNMLHGGWVLLTTALIMRASYSITKQRRNDRIVGTAAGCLIAAVLVHVLPRDWLFLPVIFTVGGAHAFANVDFRITALCASITALLQLNFITHDPTGGSLLILERLGDTVIGAGLAWGFSFLLPSWEWRNIPKLITAMIGADRPYAALALSRRRNDHDFRLARKRAHDATANLANTVRRLADEPKMAQKHLGELNDLLAANYLLASDLASMRVLFRTRKNELDADTAEKLLEAARGNVELTLATLDGKLSHKGRLSRRSLGASLGGQNAMVSLTRRLVHVERTAERLAALTVAALKEK